MQQIWNSKNNKQNHIERVINCIIEPAKEILISFHKLVSDSTLSNFNSAKDGDLNHWIEDEQHKIDENRDEEVQIT